MLYFTLIKYLKLTKQELIKGIWDNINNVTEMCGMYTEEEAMNDSLELLLKYNNLNADLSPKQKNQTHNKLK